MIADRSGEAADKRHHVLSVIQADNESSLKTLLKCCEQAKRSATIFPYIVSPSVFLDIVEEETGSSPRQSIPQLERRCFNDDA